MSGSAPRRPLRISFTRTRLVAPRLTFVRAIPIRRPPR